MATFVRHFSRSIFQVARKTPAKRKVNPQWHCTPSPCRAFSSANAWFAEGDEDSRASAISTPTSNKKSQPFTPADFTPQERADFEQLSKEEQAAELTRINAVQEALESGELDAEIETKAAEIAREIDGEVEPLRFQDYRARGQEVGFWADDEEDEFGQVEDDDDDLQEDITSVAHSELEVHREMREYARIVAWDMPLLKKFAKPFEPPALTAPLRFRYTTYMGEAHPAAKKVVVQFCTRDLSSLTEPQRIKLIKLVGVRYNPDTDVVKMSCEKFEEPAQNKRYLGDLVEKLIKEAQNEDDMFEDVPLDFRHHKPKRRLVYPEEWKLREGNVRQLLEARREVRLLEEAKPVVDGAEIVQEYVRMLPGRGSGLLGPTEQSTGARRPLSATATRNRRLDGIR